MDFGSGEGGDADMDFSEGGGDSDMDFSEGGDEGGGDEGGDAGGGGDVIGDLAGNEAQPDAADRDRPERSGEAREEIFAVQQIYALRINRVELIPSYSTTLNDPFVSHSAISLGLNYWWTNVLAIGVNFLWYEGLESESDLSFFIRRSTRLAVPVSAYQFGAHLNFTYVPIYGKFSMFNEFIFQWDSYIVGGVGIMRTRPVPVVDPEVRNFDYDIRVAFNLGIGIRVFVSRWLAVFGEIRNYMYLEQLEALDVALGDDRLLQETWTQDNPAFTSNVSVHLGLTIFLPFDFDYRLPR
ncbi:MAG: outer membrane beta-barrel domain-containing protein [Sandaracinaceae bacterium]|nr:outer membrane beta-barrel domain-containing protein [Sandaracinaceae bacterium]